MANRQRMFPNSSTDVLFHSLKTDHQGRLFRLLIKLQYCQQAGRGRQVWRFYQGPDRYPYQLQPNSPAVSLWVMRSWTLLLRYPAHYGGKRTPLTGWFSQPASEDLPGSPGPGGTPFGPFDFGNGLDHPGGPDRSPPRVLSPLPASLPTPASSLSFVLRPICPGAAAEFAGAVVAQGPVTGN